MLYPESEFVQHLLGCFGPKDAPGHTPAGADWVMLPAAEGDDATRHLTNPDDTQIFPIQMELFDFFGLHVNRLHPVSLEVHLKVENNLPVHRSRAHCALKP